MQEYQTRSIRFKALEEIEDWKIKVYTISKHGSFDHPDYYNNVLNQLKVWLKTDNGFDSSNNKIGFLILHAGTEGIFALLNWWVGTNMLNTHIYLTDPAQPDNFQKISGNGLSSCVWEFEVINHERVSWTNNVLKKHLHPNFEHYLNDVFDKEL
jgi:hypothetical protein